jgi:hypothetical protein
MRHPRRANFILLDLSGAELNYSDAQDMPGIQRQLSTTRFDADERPTGLPFSRRKRTAKPFKKRTILRAKRSAATAGWAAESSQYCFTMSSF